MLFIEVLTNHPNEILVSVRVVFDQTEGYINKKVAKLTVSEDIIEDIRSNIIINPLSLPMICPPRA